MTDYFNEEFWTHDKLVKFIGKDGDRLRIIEDIISIKTQQATLKLASKLNPASMSDEEALKLAEKLWEPETKPNQLKKILVFLAFRSNVQTFRMLERYKENPHPSVEEMARFCYYISKIILEGELSDQPLGLISTGLGGKNKKLRFFFVIFPAQSETFDKTQLKIIDNEWKAICTKYDIETEKKSRGNEYVAFTVLTPYQHDFFEVLKEFVGECNLYGNFILPKMVITNIKILKKKKILKIRERFLNDPESDITNEPF
ncbi:MAG: hypothetical protein PWR20_1747 [Bacteroidales bacterium]|jgi:hypothetical protein|nr:hypothetical protein [Bacteroidales bacterium]MDN5329847.1 hypothetical protein [Bacteroidales bacterium]NLH51592.1 hypothetical protein [Bacteroidales bacterium]NPV36438.1 hypothetical protein [Bacteroidales bacterium]